MKLFIGLILMILASTAYADEWKMTQSVDQFTDEVTHIAYIGTASGYISVGCPYLYDFGVMISFNNAYIESGRFTMRYRVNQNKAKDALVRVDSDGVITINTALHNDFVKDMVKGSTILLGLQGHSRRFTLSGSTRSINDVLGKCGLDEVINQINDREG